MVETPTQSKKDVGRDVCFMFGNQNFKIDEDGEEDLDNIAEKKTGYLRRLDIKRMEKY